MLHGNLLPKFNPPKPVLQEMHSQLMYKNVTRKIALYQTSGFQCISNLFLLVNVVCSEITWKNMSIHNNMTVL